MSELIDITREISVSAKVRMDQLAEFMDVSMSDRKKFKLRYLYKALETLSHIAIEVGKEFYVPPGGME